MLRQFREILYGGWFGFGAAVIDSVMHASMHGRGLMEEIVRPAPSMAFYRLLYLVFGTALGWALWRRNEKERNLRLVQREFCDIVDLFDGHATVVYANAQMLLATDTKEPAKRSAGSIEVLSEHLHKIRALTSKLSELIDV